MNPCDEYVVKTLRYLDNDLKGQELEDVRRHLESCVNCRANLEAEKALSQSLHRSRPLYSAPAALRDWVAATEMLYSASNRVHDPLYQRAYRILGERLSGSLQRLSSWRVLAPAALAITLCLAFVPDIVRRVQAASYVEAAVGTHRSYLNGNVPPGLQSSSPEAVTAWLAGKVPFYFRLPAAESAPEVKPAYRLTGASLVNYNGRPAALVTYETQNGKISLMAVPSESAVVAGGDNVRFGKLTFHYRNDSGFRVITWSNHGLSYALVSSVAGPARASCLVCHQNIADRSDFKDHP
jgi:anti-sigma factor RsiW